MKNFFLQKCSKKLLVVLLLTSILCTQLLIPLNITANTADQQVVNKLEQLYKSYITQYGAKTTKEGLMRVYDEALEIDGESFEAEKDAGYEVELSATVLRPVNGAKDQDGEIVPKHNGYVNIYATVKKNNAAVGNIEFSRTVKAEVKNLTYTKSSESENAEEVWNRGGVYLNKYTGTADKLVIPEGVKEINYNNRTNWCENKENVKIIILPSTMELATKESFKGFPNLQAVYIPDGCVLGDWLFENCSSLRYVRLPEDDNVNKITVQSFNGTPALTSLYIPKNIKIIGRSFNNSALRDVVLTNDDIAATKTASNNFFDGLVQQATETQIPDAALRAEVNEELTDDRGQISKRNIYILGSNVASSTEVGNTKDWKYITGVETNGAYTHVYGLAGNALDTAATGTEQTAFEGKYTTLTAEQATTLINQYNAVFNNAEVVAKLENLYKAYITEYGAKTTKEGLMRVYDEAIEIDGESFEAEKDAGYEVELSATVLRPVNGAKDQDGEIVPKYDGFVNVNATLKKDDQQVGVIEFSQTVKAEVKNLTYTKSSESESDEVWTVRVAPEATYLNSYTGTADKLVIPEGVEEITYNNRLTWCQNKENVKIIILPSTMKKVISESFRAFPNLEAIYVPDGCEFTGNSGFRENPSLRYVRLPEDLTDIPANYFWDTPALTSLYIPRTVQNLDRAFKNTALRDVVLTNENFKANSAYDYTTYFEGLIQDVNSDQIPDGKKIQNAALRAEVAEELTDDRGQIAKRNIYVLGSNATSSKVTWAKFTAVNDALAEVPVYNSKDYTQVYGLAGNALDTAATGTEQAAFEGKYTTLTAAQATTLINQYNILSNPKKGDVNLDGVVNICDLVNLYNVVNNGAEKNSTSDVDGNGSVEEADINALRRILLDQI